MPPPERNPGYASQGSFTLTKWPPYLMHVEDVITDIR